MKTFAKTKIGFSLVELIITAGVLALMSALLSIMIVKGFQSYRFSREVIYTQDQLAKAFRDFESVARGATEVEVSDQDEFIFFTYLPQDVYPAPSRIRYFMDGTTLKRGQIPPSGAMPPYAYPPQDESVKEIVKNVTNGSTLFQYYNDSSDLIEPPVPPDAVKMVKITVTSDKDSYAKPDAITETTDVSLRNLKTNL